MSFNNPFIYNRNKNGITESNSVGEQSYAEPKHDEFNFKLGMTQTASLAAIEAGNEYGYTVKISTYQTELIKPLTSGWSPFYTMKWSATITPNTATFGANGSRYFVPNPKISFK